jgi:hypothetical protein
LKEKVDPLQEPVACKPWAEGSFVKDQDSKSGDLKGLESEIDHAIDSLFVEKGGGKTKKPSPSGNMAARRSPETTPEPQSLAGRSGGLESEIDHAVDSLFVEKGQQSEGGPSASMQDLSESPPAATRIPSETPQTLPPSRSLELEAEKPAEKTGPVAQMADRARRNLENLETHLLSLEWEISRELIEKIISELSFLKEGHRNDRAVFQVADVMDKVAHLLARDEGNITPENLRFLLEAKDGIKLLSDELRDREDYKNMILSGILARYRLMHDQKRRPTEARGDTRSGGEVADMAKALRALSDELRAEIRELGRIARELQQRQPVQRASEKGVATVLVESCGRVFAIEKESVVRSVQIPYRMVRTVWRDSEIRIRGVRLPLINLFRLFKFKGKVEARDRPVVMTKKGERTLAILADRVLERTEIPLRSIREEKGLAYVRAVGSLGGGRTVYFLDLDRLVVEF